MGTVSQLHDNVRPPAHRIETEEEAISAARELAAGFRRQASERDINRLMPNAELDALSQSGLTAITVPPEYAGLDISNALLAEIVAIVAESDASIGNVLTSHFRVLEGLRNQPSEELKIALFTRALDGDRFAATRFSDQASLVAEGSGFRLTGRAEQAAAILFSDWIAAAAIDPGGHRVTLHLQRDSDELQAVDDWDAFGLRTNGTATLIAGKLHVNADTVTAALSGDHTTEKSLGLLLQTAVSLGIARAAFADLLVMAKEPSALFGKIGERAIRIEIATGALEQAGRKLDIAQVSPAEAAMAEAYFSASSACLTATEVALDTANALFELARGATGSIALNLDRHWRNARIHDMAIQREPLLNAAGAHILKIRES
ncbi:acyl-CoA dehydrogenase family protein [Rhizobium sp. 1399]|jgi:alkylation response protein AidB-like acyl-CoA dehydrogenase|uniref:acyl-CoA dehydrogenase family protein n=1 Tax=Rhizobium sp. 1399 TaxID=2817758 RepID=UPI00286525F1|nr:acyl-CoA dehydrogenase family protein [Rhizobium sp. 1399]MDR6668590.1 alkylation response protein AidB-like acyl-CoA dehydrogenase [Rhizobium sp. 1399]